MKSNTKKPLDERSCITTFELSSKELELLNATVNGTKFNKSDLLVLMLLYITDHARDFYNFARKYKGD